VQHVLDALPGAARAAAAAIEGTRA
jgi:hypothetical protein